MEKEIKHELSTAEERNGLIKKLFDEGKKYTYTEKRKDGTYLVVETIDEN